ncbi:MAG: hypothetical protein JRC91_12010 [Deltaproteobacteria bacterium]|nr:hypothetical protein [Deltaproteobacteria bacterium]
MEKIWVLESEKRYQAYKDGSIKGIPLEQLRSRWTTPWTPTWKVELIPEAHADFNDPKP